MQFGFPPLFPLPGRLTSPLLGGNDAMALLVVSNVAFVLALYYAYRLGEHLLGDADGARRFTRYVVLLPTAFLCQAALTESLFLCLALACFYYAERRKWVLVGIAGFLLALSRSVGFTIAVPLAMLLLEQGRYRLSPGALWGYVKAGWPLVLVPAGWLAFMAHGWMQTGDWLRYKHDQERNWGIVMRNPVKAPWEGLHASPANALRAWVAVAFLALTAIAVMYVKRIRPAYIAYAVITIMIPLTLGAAGYKSILRYLVVVFPVALLFALWGRRRAVDTYLTAGLALLQGALFVV